MLKKCLLSLILLLFIFGCNKSEGGDSSSQSGNIAGEIEEESNNEVVEEESFSDVMNTYQGLSLFKNLGKDLIGLLSVGEVLSTTGVVKKDHRNWEFLEVVKSNGNRGWALKKYMIANAKPGAVIVTEDILIFNENNDNSMSNIEMSPFRVLAVDTKLIDDTFSKISWHKNDDTYTVVKDKFIFTEDLSFNSDDIEFAKIITAYLNEDKKDVKEELLKNAKSLVSISPSYRNYLNRLAMDDSLPMVPSVNSILLEYEPEVTINSDSAKLELSTESKKLEVLDDFDFKLLNYLLIDPEYNEDGLTINIYNTSNFNLTTLPGELTLSGSENKYYLGVLDGLVIPSKGKASLKLNGEIPKEDLDKLNPGFKLGISFVNGMEISSDQIVLEGSEEE